jgi:hypothetical protein
MFFTITGYTKRLNIFDIVRTTESNGDNVIYGQAYIIPAAHEASMTKSFTEAFPFLPCISSPITALSNSARVFYRPSLGSVRSIVLRLHSFYLFGIFLSVFFALLAGSRLVSTIPLHRSLYGYIFVLACVFSITLAAFFEIVFSVNPMLFTQNFFVTFIIPFIVFAFFIPMLIPMLTRPTFGFFIVATLTPAILPVASDFIVGICAEWKIFTALSTVFELSFHNSIINPFV